MFLYLIACFDSPESSSDVAQLQQDVSALKSLLETQNSKIHTLEEDYSLLLAEYNTVLTQNTDQQGLIETLQSDFLTYQTTVDATLLNQQELNQQQATEDSNQNHKNRHE